MDPEPEQMHTADTLKELFRKERKDLHECHKEYPDTFPPLDQLTVCAQPVTFRWSTYNPVEFQRTDLTWTTHKQALFEEPAEEAASRFVCLSVVDGGMCFRFAERVAAAAPP